VRLLGQLVSSIHVTRHAEAGIICQDAFKATRGCVRSISDDDLPACSE